jgi:hypothetical protein
MELEISVIYLEKYREHLKWRNKVLSDVREREEEREEGTREKEREKERERLAVYMKT